MWGSHLGAIAHSLPVIGLVGVQFSTVRPLAGPTTPSGDSLVVYLRDDPNITQNKGVRSMSHDSHFPRDSTNTSKETTKTKTTNHKINR